MNLYPELILIVPSLYSLFISKKQSSVVDGISGPDITMPIVVDGGSNMNHGSNMTTLRNYNFKFISSIFNSFSLIMVALYLALRNNISLPENIAISLQQLLHPSIWTSVRSATSTAFRTLLPLCTMDIISIFTRESIYSGSGYYNHGKHKSYEPAAGVLWYLDAQMLPAYELYFEVPAMYYILYL